MNATQPLGITNAAPNTKQGRRYNQHPYGLNANISISNKGKNSGQPEDFDKNDDGVLSLAEFPQELRPFATYSDLNNDY